MKIAIFGATGMVGSRIAAELRSRGHQVTGYSRRGSDSTRAGTLTDGALVATVAAGHDAVVSAIGPSRSGEPHSEFIDAIATAAANLHGTRLFVVGGAGTLRVDGTRLVDSPEFPEPYRAEALAHAAALETLEQTAQDVDWVYLSPAPLIEPGKRTGSYRVAGDAPAGQSISAEDYAVAVADELEHPAHRRERFTVAN
ncbi:Putative epimerase/dehydratase [Mycobacteroides abscessus subsp. bolletii]|uniref:NAD(P)-dependent oxidoreductase n=1 Tax=Mycobacteroides abscessus TaxID=36809 RepID=UPI0002DB1CC3|nr:NAD(P)H-binding protein [Mycobacteroides abscessus]AWG49875.1 FMN reductase [Mycobacteroides abscessus]MBN7547749.1 NAD(P)H-binding protein [Mycobacteroides abscessus subsp. abscessus]MDO3098045.1 NAD(P)H-binding protein [Mycobacteroides abscessus subsp. abscessus]MDO3129343.1 NAD(P)H-binding protein [Mycobacteroides abscessus subsp. bolletii]MDO3185355.1 NAD(P)H-binding protein [Mycobacteroides abscessus subsp. abscessus]